MRVSTLPLVLILVSCAGHAVAEEGGLPPATGSATVTPPSANSPANPPASASSAPPTTRPPAPQLADHRTIAINQDVSVIIAPPHDWTVNERDRFRVPDIDQLRDSAVSVQLSWAPGSSEGAPAEAGMYLICATAPASEWSSGLESLVFERLNDVASTELGHRMSLDTFQPQRLEKAPPVFRQDFRAEGRLGPSRKVGTYDVLEEDALDRARAAAYAVGRHMVCFSDSPERVIVCSVACMEPANPDVDTCTAVLGTFQLAGKLGAEPQPSFLVKLLVGVQRRPATLLGLVVGLLSTLAGGLMILRGFLLRPAGPRA